MQYLKKYATQKEAMEMLYAGGHIAIEWNGPDPPKRRIMRPDPDGVHMRIKGQTVERLIEKGKIDEFSRRKFKDGALVCYLGLPSRCSEENDTDTTSCIGEMPNDSPTEP